MQKYIIINKIFLLIFINLFFYDHYLIANTPEQENKTSKLKKLGNIILSSNEQNERLKAGESFRQTLTELLNKPNSYKQMYLDTPPLYIINSPDNKFRILSWSVKIDDNNWNYYSILQLNSKHPTWVDLDNFKGVTSDKTELKCIYYDIVTSSKKDKQYILLGWRKRNSVINTKIIEPLSISDNAPILGIPLFKNYGNNTYRLLFNYPSNANLVINYQKRKKRIIIEHLSILEDNNIYMPDGTYDALELQGSNWILVKNVNP